MLLDYNVIGNLQGFSEKNSANERILFGLHQNNRLKATLHWVQDFQRIIRDPKMDGIEDKSNFKENIDAERVWASIHKYNNDKS